MVQLNEYESPLPMSASRFPFGHFVDPVWKTLQVETHFLSKSNANAYRNLNN